MVKQKVVLFLPKARKHTYHTTPPIALLKLASMVDRKRFDICLITAKPNVDYETQIIEASKNALCVCLSVLTGNDIGNAIEVIKKIKVVSNAPREVSAKYEAKALYTSAREQITQDIFSSLSPMLAERGIVLENVLLRDLGLPEMVTQAIEAKLKAEQEAEQMQFILQKEKLEAERKTVEAEGIKNAQEIIAKSLTPEYLHWYWIQQISNQPNVRYIATEAGLPIFKEVGD